MGRALVALAFAVFVLACGASPSCSEIPKGTLVVVIRTGAEKVPFEPSLERIRAASTQLGALLGHGVAIEVDGALLPPSRDGADELVANVVEVLAQDLDFLRQREPAVFAFAKDGVERVVVRYAPADAAERGREHAVLDAKEKTIDVARPSARHRALDRGIVAAAVLRAFEALERDRYADAAPDSLPASEHRAWFEYHRHRSARPRAGDPYEGLGNVLSPSRVRGMLRLAAIVRDEALAKDVRAELVKTAGAFASAYVHDADKADGAPPGSSFRVAEAEYVKWLGAELPRMSQDEKLEVARALFVIDPRIPHGQRDRYSRSAFPGIDRHAFFFSAADAWAREGYPPRSRDDRVHPFYASLLCPFVVEDANGGQVRHAIGRCEETWYYGWAAADPEREAVLAKGLLDRNDPKLAAVVFHAVRPRDMQARIALLRRFEASPALWRVGAAELVPEGARPSNEVLEEGRRLWRASPVFRPVVLRWFAMHMENAYGEQAWSDLLQGTLADDAVLVGYLAEGPEAFRLLPAAWPALKKGARARTIVAKLPAILDAKVRAAPGHADAAGTLVKVANRLCDERALDELAEIHAFATRELPKRPGEGLAEVVEQASPASCAKRTAENEKKRRFEERWPAKSQKKGDPSP